MFDVATRPQPPSSQATTALGVPFDWRLAPPVAPSALPWTDFAAPSGTPTVYADVLATYALALDDTLQTAIIISLFTDARAGRDDVLPLGVTDRRGWVGDEFMAGSFDNQPDAWGSLLWLLYFGKVTADVLPRAQYAAKQSLRWMLRKGVVSQVDVEALWVGDRLAVRPTIYKPEQATPVYDVLWGTSLSRGAVQ